MEIRLNEMNKTMTLCYFNFIFNVKCETKEDESFLPFMFYLIMQFNSESTWTSSHTLIDRWHNMIWCFEIFLNTVAKSCLFRFAKLIGSVIWSQCFFSANLSHLSGHLDLSFECDSFHFLIFSVWFKIKINYKFDLWLINK